MNSLLPNMGLKPRTTDSYALLTELARLHKPCVMTKVFCVDLCVCTFILIVLGNDDGNMSSLLKPLQCQIQTEQVPSILR